MDELLYMQVMGKIKSSDYLNLPIILEEAACRGDRTAGNIWIQYGKRIVVYLEARMRKMGIWNAIQTLCFPEVSSNVSFRDFRMQWKGKY